MQHLHEFLHMGGYAAYVWSAFGISFITLLANLVLPLNTEKKILGRIKRQLEKAEQKK